MPRDYGARSAAPAAAPKKRCAPHAQYLPRPHTTLRPACQRTHLLLQRACSQHALGVRKEAMTEVKGAWRGCHTGCGAATAHACGTVCCRRARGEQAAKGRARSTLNLVCMAGKVKRYLQTSRVRVGRMQATRVHWARCIRRQKASHAHAAQRGV